MTSIRLRISLFQVYLLLCSLLRGFSAFHTEGQVQFGLFALAMTPCHAGFKRLHIGVSPTKDALGELILVVGSFPVMVYMYLLESTRRWMTRRLKQLPTTVLAASPPMAITLLADEERIGLNFNGNGQSSPLVCL